MLVQPGKIERVESVIQPAVHPIAGVCRDDAGRFRIDVIAGPASVMELRDDDGQRPSPASICLVLATAALAAAYLSGVAQPASIRSPRCGGRN